MRGPNREEIIKRQEISQCGVSQVARDIKYYQIDQIKENGTGGACSTHGRETR
jgi:hypothetical protein